MTPQQASRNPWKYFLLTFAYSWTIWLPFVLDGLGVNLPFNVTGFTMVAVMIGAFAPMLAAITLVAREDNPKATRKFLAQAIDFHIKPVYLVIALAIPVVIHLISHYLSIAIGLDVAKTLIPEDVPVSPFILVAPYFILMLIVGGGQEEFGWRGYALPALQKKIGAIPASLVIGLVWGLWHHPLWFMEEDQHSAYSFLAFIMMTTSLSLVYTWLYNASGKKLVSVLFLHAMSNTAAPLLPFLHGIEGKPETAYWVYAGINVVFGVIFGFLLRKRSEPIPD